MEAASSKNFDKPREYKFTLYRLEKVKYSLDFKPPSPRSGHRIVCNDKSLYSFGGYYANVTFDHIVSGEKLYPEIWQFNFTTCQWNKRYQIRHTVTTQVASSACLLIDDKLIIFGGTGLPFGNSVSNTLYVCQVSEETWKLLKVPTSGECPDPSYGQTILLYNDYLYVIGGTTGFIYTLDIHRLNIHTRVWELECRDPLEGPSGRYRHGMAFENGIIYIFGGGNDVTVHDFKILPAYNLNNHKWMLVNTFSDPKLGPLGFPAPRTCHECVQHQMYNGDTNVFIFGGRLLHPVSYFCDLWVINLRTLQWRLISQSFLPQPIYFTSSCITPPGKMYFFGGVLTDDRRLTISRTNQMYSFWVDIPKLKEIAWESLLFYNRNIIYKQSTELAQLGIPKEFIERIAVNIPTRST